MQNLLTHGFAVILAVVASFQNTVLANRQTEGSFESGWFLRPLLDRKGLDNLLNELSLENSRRVILEQLYHDLDKGYLSGTAAYRNAIAEIKQLDELYQSTPEVLRNPIDLAKLEKRQLELLGQWLPHRYSLETQFHNDVKPILADRDVEYWERSVRQTRRNRMLPWLGKAGGALMHPPDLHKLLLNVAVEEQLEDSVKVSILHYELELDVALRDIEKQYYQIINRIRSLMDRQTENSNVQEKENDKATRLMIKPSIITDRHFNAIASEIPEEILRAFQREVAQFYHPHLFVRGPVEMATDALLENESLAGEKKEYIKTISTSYRDLNDEYSVQIMIDMQRARDATRRLTARGTSANRRSPPKKKTGPLQYSIPRVNMKYWRRRYFLAKDTLRQLRALFTPEEFRILPPHVQLLLEW